MAVSIRARTYRLMMGYGEESRNPKHPGQSTRHRKPGRAQGKVGEGTAAIGGEEPLVCKKTVDAEKVKTARQWTDAVPERMGSEF